MARIASLHEHLELIPFLFGKPRLQIHGRSFARKVSLARGKFYDTGLGVADEERRPKGQTFTAI